MKWSSRVLTWGLTTCNTKMKQETQSRRKRMETMENKTKQVRRRKKRRKKNNKLLQENALAVVHTQTKKNNSRKKWQPKKFIDFLTRRRRRRLPAAPLPKNWEKQATQTTTNIALNERATVASSSTKMTSTAFVFVLSKRSELHCC